MALEDGFKGGGPRPSRLSHAAVGLAGLSLILNAYLFWQLRRPERWLVPAAERVAERLATEDAAFTYEIRIPAGTPIHADIPVDKRFSVAVDTVIEIDTRVRVPFETPFGARSVVLPIRAAIPLRARLPIHIQHAFRLRTETNQEIKIPLTLRARDLPLRELLR